MDPREERYGIGPWLNYPASDARGDALNYDPITNEYVGPSVADYRTAGLGGHVPEEIYYTTFNPANSDAPIGPPPQPGHIPESSASYIYEKPPAEAPRTAPASLTSHVSSDVRWSPERAPAPAAPATAPTTTPPVTEAWGGQSAGAPASTASGSLANQEAPLPADGPPTANNDDWSARALRSPATSPAGGNLWDGPQFKRFFATLKQSNPRWARLIRGLPESALSARPLGAPGQQGSRPLTRPRTTPTDRTRSAPLSGEVVMPETPPATAPGGSAASREALAAALALRKR